MRYLTFEFSEGDEGVTTMEAMASTSVEHHAAVMAEVDRVLGWAWGRFPQTQGSADDGCDWDHDLQVVVEGGTWHTVTLTLTGSDTFVEAFQASFDSCRD